MRSRKRKVYVAVLALALVALGVDRLVLSPGRTGPKEGEAATPRSARTDPAADAGVSGDAGRQTTPPAEIICERLADLAKRENLDLANVADAFRPGPKWRKGPPPRAKGPAPPPETPPAEEFKKRHKLVAVMADDEGGKAVIDDVCLRVGDTLDGLKLVAVGDGSAVFAWKDVRVELRLVPR